MVARRPFLAQVALTVAVLFSGVGAALASGSGSGPVALAAGQVISLVQHTSDNLASFPSVAANAIFEATSNGQHQRVSLTGYLTLDGSQAQFEISIPNIGKAQERVVNGKIYVNVADLRKLPDGKTWLALPYTGAATSADGGGALSGLTMLAGVNGPVRRVGAQTIDGVRTTHYRLHIDLNAAIARAPVANQAALRQFSGVLVSPPTVDAWLDAQGFPRQLRLGYVLRTGSLTMTMKLRGSQHVLHVQAPPASQVEVETTANPLGG